MEWRKLVLSAEWQRFFSDDSPCDLVARKRVELNKVLRQLNAENSMKFQEAIFRARAQLDLLDWLGEGIARRVASEQEHDPDSRRVAFLSDVSAR